MGDLGSDAGQSALSLSAKAMEAILRLLEKLIEAWRNNPERQLAKLKLETAKTELEQQKILERLNGKKGFVDYKDLKRSGMELTPLGIHMTKAEMREFSALCKREGVLFSGMTDSTDKNKDGIKTYEIICKKQDLEKVSGIFNRLNDEIRINNIDNRIAEIKARAGEEGRELTQQDKVNIAALQEEKAAIQRGYCDQLNNETAKNVIDRAVTGEVSKKLTLDEALNRLTGRSIDRDVVTIVADANDPSKYIKCHGYQDTYNDKPYIKTEYEVFKGSESVFKTHDGRFDGRPEGYWNQQKEAIQEAGEFSGTFFKFPSVVEYQKWAEAAREQNMEELASMSKEGEKDYSNIIKELEIQLDNDGALLQDGKVVDKLSGEPLAIYEGMTGAEQAIVAEAMVIGKQLGNYQEIQRLSEEISLAKAEVLTSDEGTEERAAAEASLSNLESRYEAALKTEQQLITERKEINAVQAEQEIRNVAEQSKEQDGRDNVNDEHPDDRRSERITEKDNRQMTMEEAKGQIEAVRAKDGARLNDMKDRQVQDQGVKVAAKALKPTGHTDR